MSGKDPKNTVKPSSPSRISSHDPLRLRSSFLLLRAFSLPANINIQPRLTNTKAIAEHPPRPRPSHCRRRPSLPRDSCPPPPSLACVHRLRLPSKFQTIAIANPNSGPSEHSLLTFASEGENGMSHCRPFEFIVDPNPSRSPLRPR